MKNSYLVLLFFFLLLFARAGFSQSIKPLSRRLPPPGIKLPEETESRLQTKLTELTAKYNQIQNHPLAADVQVYLKAVKLALHYGEFYSEREIPRADDALLRAEDRLEQLLSGKSDWSKQRGLVVRGYRSKIDDSPQPYGLVIPDKLDLAEKVPLYVWLHGRGDKITDLHFIHRRQSSKGQVAPQDAIVLHPFGRHCIGFKSTGEIDVLEAIEHVKSQYKIDSKRIVLMGFSMGGAGCWHLGAHYADRWVAMSPGAGFAETAKYNRLKPADYPPNYEQALWGLYDVPGYVRNLFNLPVVAYSGEIDKQIQAARVMEQAFLSHDRKLPHLIGPGMGHKYHPDSLRDILARMRQARDIGLDNRPRKVHLQTRTLRYSRMHWVKALGLAQHWQESRIDAEITDFSGRKITVTTKNITALKLKPFTDMAGSQITIDSQTVMIPESEATLFEVELSLQNNRWVFLRDREESDSLKKRPGLQGPIDDVVTEPFLVVTPGGKSPRVKVRNWVEFELDNFIDRWRALYRGELRIKRDSQVTPKDIANYHLILWGDPESNRLIGQTLNKLPLTWNENELRIGKHATDSAEHVPVLIYPNPMNREKYVVLNSGPTFRPGHDRTNSLQNPKLPDWAVIDLSQPPDEFAPGNIVAADFFDENWQLR